MTSRKLLAAVAALCVAGVIAAAAGSAAPKGPPPPPKSANGKPVTALATVPGTPTAFAFDGETTFVGVFGNEQTLQGGGIFTIAEGKATKVPGTPSGIAGVIEHAGTLYASVVEKRGGKIIALKGWDGTKFASSKTIFEARQTVGSVNGLAWGHGRIYAGGGLVVDVGKNGKAPPSPFPHPYSVFSIRPNGTGFKVVSRGVRQPWQLTFVQGASAPVVSVLSQESGPIPPDAIVAAEPGANFGFPRCFVGVGIECKGTHFSQPFITLPQHASPMGIQSVGHTLYVALFGGIKGSGPEVVSFPVERGAKPTPVLTGFAAPVVALGIDGSRMLAGDISGDIYETGM